MNRNKIKEARISKGISITELSRKTGVSSRVHMSFRKRYAKKSFGRSNAENSKRFGSKSIRNIFLGVKRKIKREPEKNKEI